MEIIQATYLRDVVGELHQTRAWYRLLPVITCGAGGNKGEYRYFLPSGSLLFEKYRGQSLRDQPWESKHKFFSPLQKVGLRILLTRDLGLGTRTVDILLSRPLVNFLRIEEFISGVVDALWVANEMCFLHKSDDFKTMKTFVRKAFAVGTFDLGSLTRSYKEWSNYLFHRLSETVTIGELIQPAYNNFCKTLDRLEYIKSFKEGSMSHLDLQRLSHTVSTRQLPYMGKQTELKARAAFKAVLVDPFRPTAHQEFLMSAAARRIGGMCKTIKGTKFRSGTAHISVTSSGEYEYSFEKGAQATAVGVAMERRLNFPEPSTFNERTPFGIARHVEGIPLWKTLFRTDEQTEKLLYKDYLSPALAGFPKEQPGRYYGLDELTGRQIMYVAWKDMTHDIRVRAEVVPEMGDKARHITVGPYWLNVIQAPLAHMLIECMRFHPSVFSSFSRQDQAWEAVKGLVKHKITSLKKHYVLSSDLKDATNAQQWELTKGMLRSFIHGYGFAYSDEYLELALSTLSERRVEFRDGTFVFSKVGIMMGESLAKPALTLLNLAVEELSFLQFMGKEYLLYSDLPAPKVPWRYIHIGGDDHLAVGPSRYLDKITENHRFCGSHISPGKHGYSRVCVKYTERLLNLRNLEYGKPFDPVMYGRSIIVDSVKIRLLERGQSTRLLKDNKNVAIGKSAQLIGCLEWIQQDPEYWPVGKIDSVRNLFIHRMGPLLPSKHLHPRAYAAVHLPQKWGGFGLGLRRELLGFWRSSPELHRWLFKKALTGVDMKDDLRVLRTLNSNVSARGVESIMDYKREIISQLTDYPSMVEAVNYRTLKERFPSPNDNAKYTMARAAEAHFMEFSDFADYVTRGNLFQELLIQKTPLRQFNTVPYCKGYQKIWSRLLDEGIDAYDDADDLTEVQLKAVLSSTDPLWWFDVSQPTTADIGAMVGEDGEEEYDFVEMPYSKIFTGGFPTLKVGKRFLGFKNV